MKKIFLVLFCFAFWPCCGSSQTPIVSAKPTASAIPVKPLKWESYMNPKYGFSIKYPSLDRPEARSLNGQSMWDEYVINIPTLAVKNPGLIIRVITDASVEKWNKSMEKNNNEDMGPFPYPMKDLYESIKLPVGSKCAAFKDGKVVNLNGVKALRLVYRSTPERRIGYFIYRGGTRWLEIDELPVFIGVDDAILETLKLFEPK